MLEFVAILRKDCNQWAIPGGRVKPDERVSGHGPDQTAATAVPRFLEKSR